MKTLLLTKLYPPVRCGVGDYVAELARFLAGRGERVCVLTEPLKPGAPRVAHDGVTVVEMPMRGWRDLPRLLRTIRAERPDVVQLEYSNYAWSRWGCAFWWNALFLLLRMRGAFVHLALHEFPLHFRRHPLHAAVAAVQRLHFWLLCATASEVCANTRERVDILHRWLPWRRDAIRYRPNASCNPVFAFPPEWRSVLRQQRGAGPQDVVLAVYGLYGRGKNTEAAVEAAVQLREELPVRFWFLGDASRADSRYVAHLRELAAPLGEWAWWSGNLSPEDISRHLQAVDIFLLPQTDGHLTRSGSFLAAAAHGLPVIAVRNVANQSEFAHGENTWLVEHGTAPALAAAVRHVASDPALRTRLGSSLRALYANAFDWAKTHPPQRAKDDEREIPLPVTRQRLPRFGGHRQ